MRTILIIVLLLLHLSGVQMNRPTLVLTKKADITSMENPSLWQIFDILNAKDYVDLTHSFRPGIPHWEGFPNETVETVFNFSTSGFLAEKFILVGQWGTHVDAPVHFHQGKRTYQIDVKEMVLPLVVLDIHEKVSENPDYTINMDDVFSMGIQIWQDTEGCFVALRTDWSNAGPTRLPCKIETATGTLHYPGWSMEVLRYLYEDRKITASGHETTDTDPGFRRLKITTRWNPISLDRTISR